jgi:hypothetical protein
MKKNLSVTAYLLMLVFVFSCGTDVTDDTGNQNPINSTPNQGEQVLRDIIDSTTPIDSSMSYDMTGDELTIYSDSTDSQGLTIVFSDINDSQAIAVLDTNLIPAAFGGVELVFERMSGSGNTLENDLWRIDSLRISSDSLGVSGSVAMPGESYLVFDSETGEVISTFDTAGLQQQLLTATIAGCPMILFQAASQYPNASLLLPVDSLDAARSTCDTSWGYKGTQEVYVVSNGVDSLYVYNAETKEKKSGISLETILALIALVMPALTGSL